MDKNIVVWGTGRLTQSFYKDRGVDEIICFIDSDEKKTNNNLFGIPIFMPDKLKEVNFRKLIIFVSAKYDEIREYSMNVLNISQDKIEYWCNYYNQYHDEQVLSMVESDCIKKGYYSLVDVGINFRNRLNMNNRLALYGCNEENREIYPIYRNVFHEIVDRIEKLPSFVQRGGIFLGRIDDLKRVDSCKKKIYQCIEMYESVYFSLPYDDSKEKCELYAIKNGLQGEVEEWCLKYERLFCVSARKIRDTHIYIAMHREFQIPKKEGYIPLWLGKTQDNKWGFQEDKDNYDICHLNSLINECTGLYWMWKNAVCEYIGLVHYRRYFAANNEIITVQEIENLLRKNDIIVAEKNVYEKSIQKHLQETINKKAYIQGYTLIRKHIEARQPDYVGAFDAVMEGNTMFPCNMFITSKEIFDRYCEWIFSIIIDAAEQIDVSGYDNYSKRVIGFFAERLFTVWLMKQPLKIKEIPIMLVDDKGN